MGEARQDNIQSFAFVLSVCAAFCICLVFIRGSLSSGQSSEIELESRINPNNATIESLIRLPGIGISRAKAIVDYRERFGVENGVNRVFLNCSDLQKVKGIGPKTVQNLSGWLKFE
ncbi:MAG: ComEA family DNA-binding protein [Sedimentisphaerales bacterium]|nr:ComEA family DNA-binding protein [Sedimentisphaerales bacterium]